MTAGVRIEGLSRRFPGSDRAAVDALDLDVEKGEIVCLVGPSGCGKSTTLRMVAGLDTPDAGRVHIGDKDMTGVPPQERDVAMVFQGFALYPHMKVRQILEFPLKMRKVEAAARQKAVAETAEMLGITRLLGRRPGQLSGGEQQRVAMGRAIVRRPQAFLFDEPLSNLDAALRAELRVELGKLLARLEATALYVTHDQVEAMTLGHRIAVLRAGKLEQCDTPRRIYEAPASTFVAAFFGTPPMNLVDADARVMGIRPEHVRLSGDGDHRLQARVTAVEPLGAETHVELDASGQKVRTRLDGFDAPSIGSDVTLAFDEANVRWFDRETGKAL